MEELVDQILTVARGMWRFRWSALAVAWVVAIIGVGVVVKIPDQYEASARIYVDTQSILKPLMSGLAVQPNVEQQVIMLSRTLISRPNVEKLVRMADLDLKNDSRAKQEALIEKLMDTLEIKSTARDNLYTLSFKDPDSAKAQRVIQSLVSIFVESSLGASRKDTQSAKFFINEQIKSYEAKLEEAEARLKEFRLRNIDLQTPDGRDSAARLGDLGAQLDQARLELREAETARDAAKTQIAAERSQSGDAAAKSLLEESALSVSTPEIDARIELQKKNLDALLQRFTEAHPDIINARHLITDLEAQKKKEVAEKRKLGLAASGVPGGMGSSLAYQELNKVLATSEVQVASLRARVGEYTTRYEQARKLMKTAPQLEAEAAQLNRDYEINKKNYETLVARRESAEMTGDLDVASGVADFRLIDPPRTSAKPVSPNRLLLLPIALIAGLAGGLFTAFAFSQMRPVFHRAADLRSSIDLPLLGVVSRVLSDTDKRRERVDLVRFSIASGSLVGIFMIGLIAMSLITRTGA
jgi:polysaccharide chain length determinant protein (PEP-CTERM system associated)